MKSSMMWYNNGKGIEEDLQDISKKYEYLENRNKALAQENKELKQEHYKDTELQRLESENAELKKQLTRGFPISEEEQRKIDEWSKLHDCSHKGMRIKGLSQYRFEIIPGIGYNAYVKCSCGKEFCFYQE